MHTDKLQHFQNTFYQTILVCVFLHEIVKYFYWICLFLKNKYVNINFADAIFPRFIKTCPNHTATSGSTEWSRSGNVLVHAFSRLTSRGWLLSLRQVIWSLWENNTARHLIFSISKHYKHSLGVWCLFTRATTAVPGVSMSILRTTNEVTSAHCCENNNMAMAVTQDDNLKLQNGSWLFFLLCK